MLCRVELISGNHTEDKFVYFSLYTEKMQRVRSYTKQMFEAIFSLRYVFLSTDADLLANGEEMLQSTQKSVLLESKLKEGVRVTFTTI